MNFQRRMILAMALSLGIIFAYQTFFVPPPAVDEQAAAEGQVGASSDGDALGSSSSATQKKSDDAAASSAGETTKGEAESEGPSAERMSHTLVGEHVELVVGNGPRGMIERVLLLDDRFRDEDENGESVGHDFLQLGEKATLELGIDRSWSDFDLPLRNAEVVEQSNTVFEVKRGNEKVEVRERLELKEGYEVAYSVRVENKSAERLRYSLRHGLRLGVPETDNRFDVSRALCSVPGDVDDYDWSDLEDGQVQSELRDLRWVGVDSKYFVAALVAEDELDRCSAQRESDGSGIWVTAQGPAREVGAGATQELNFGLFLGPKSSDDLENFSLVEFAGLEYVIDWGWFGGLSKALGSLMLTLLRFFHDLTGFWGVAIILLTCVVKLVTLPLTLKQYESMRAMRELAPELKALQEKYGKDPVKLNQERQSLLTRKGVNPLAGCLPMLIQFPIWIALYAMLGTVVELYHEPFLWLKDLTKPDDLYILPIAMAVLMWFQMHIQPSAGDSQQQAVMKWMMPGIFLFMMWFLPSGLGVYIFANIVLSLIQSYIQLRPARKAAKSAAS